jgi:5-methylcytosine-specific restriction protein A
MDPDYSGVGMTRGGTADKLIWNRFVGRREELAEAAAVLRRGVTDPTLFSPIPEEGEDEAPEGRLLYRRHRTRERDQRLVKRKKDAALKKGPLACEVCDFIFEEAYGELGKDYIECHHRRPLSESGTTTTKLADLALLCSNCHRMAHRGNPWPTVEELRALVAQEDQ